MFVIKMGDKKEIMAIHLKLKQTLCDQFVTGSPEYEHFAKQVELQLGPGLAQSKRTLHDKLEALEQRGLIKPGQYGTLREMLEESNNHRLLDYIEETEKKMESLKVPAESNSTPAPKTAKTFAKPESYGTVDRTNTGIQESSGAEVPRKRQRTSGNDEADPGDSEDFFKIGSHQKGYLLILNAKEQRKGNENDVEKLVEFFHDELRFDYDDPRSLANQDFSRDEFIEYLQDQQIKLNMKTCNNKYYCFVCVIMSHGSEKGIRTRGGEIVSTEEIRKMFNNQNMPNFTGRPKLFFIQACRGNKDQTGVEYDDEDDEHIDQEDDDIEDEDDGTVALPIDADVLMAFSTTPGWKSNRRTGGPVVGSWFIHECVQVFRDQWRSRHVEEMLIKVRSNVARNWQKNELDKPTGRQMPCVWSTLTKMLKLKKFE